MKKLKQILKEALNWNPTWTPVDLSQQEVEMTRTSKELGIPEPVIVKAAEHGHMENLTDEEWKSLSNSESFKVKSLKDAEDYAEHYGRGIGHILKAKKLASPFILRRQGQPSYAINGETRLRVARAMGVYPKIFVVDLENE